jgi:hypothetical protein
MSLVNVSLGEASVLVPAQPKEMISVGVTPTGKTKVRINSSSISVIQECLRKSQYLLEEKWKSENESPALTFGSAIHKALEVFYTGSPEERILPAFEECERLIHSSPVKPNLVLNAIQAFVDKTQALSALPDGDKRSILNGVWLLHCYFKTYINDPYSVYIDDEGPFLERTFSYVMHEDDKLIIELFGTIDFMFRHITDGNLLPGDHKTSSALSFQGQSYFDRERPNHQYTAYMMMLNKVCGLNLTDFMVNVIEVKAKPKTARGSMPSFPRQITRRDEGDYTEFKEVVLKVVRDYLYARKHSEWPLGPTDACNKYGGCQYKQVCAAPQALRKNILTSKFTQQKGNTNGITQRNDGIEIHQGIHHGGAGNR